MKILLAGVSLCAAIALVAIIALTAASDSLQNAEATHQPTVAGQVDIVAIDTEPTGNTGSAFTDIDGCLSVAVSDTFNIDVVVDELHASNPLAGYGFDILYDPAIVQLGTDNDADNAARTTDTTDNDGDTIVDEPGEGYDEDPSESSPPFGVDNDGDTVVDEDPLSHTHVKLPGATDFSPFPQGNNAAEPGGGGRYRVDGGAFSGFSSGVGAIVRIPVVAVGSGVATLDLNDVSGGDGTPDILDAAAASMTVNNVLDGQIAVGGPCPTATDVEVTSVTTTAPASGTAGVAFSVDADVNVSNLSGLDPVNVDTAVTLNLPSDCTTGTNPVTVQDTSVSIAGSPVLVGAPSPSASWSVTCTSPSFHDFTTSATATIDDAAAFDSNGTNNSANSAASTTAVSATTDLKVQGVAVTGPSSQATTASPFDVTATTTIHNNGPFTPTLTDTTVTLVLPNDCTTGDVNPRTIQNTSLAASVATDVPVTWAVSCTNRSDHSFTADASVAPDDIHVTDSDGTNDRDTSPATIIPVLDVTDLKTVGVTVTGPATVAVGQAFDVTVAVTRHNNGPIDPVLSDTFIILNTPGDCETGNITSDPLLDVSLAASIDAVVQAVFSITCSAPSQHTFTADTEIAVGANEVHVGDSDATNDFLSGEGTVPVTADTDVEVASVSVDAPASADVNEAFDVSVDAGVLNNGPYGPVQTDVTLSLDIPADCTADPAGDQVEANLSLAVSATATDVPTKTWSVTCSKALTNTFEATVSIAVDQLHLTDTDAANNTRSGTAAAVTTVGPSSLPPTGGIPGEGGTNWSAILAALAGLAALSGGAFLATRRVRRRVS